MCIMVYEENRHNRRKLKKIFEELYKIQKYEEEVYFFRESDPALLCAETRSVAAVFISMEDSKGRGFFLARKLRDLDRKLNLIPMASSLIYAKELVSMHVSGYLLGDITTDKVWDELENLRYPIVHSE